MDVSEPHQRRRGFFLHSDTIGEPDSGEHENPEGFIIRVRLTRRRTRSTSSIAAPAPARGLARGRSTVIAQSDDNLPEIRSGSVTGSRQRAHLPR